MTSLTSGIVQSPKIKGHKSLYFGGVATIFASTCHHISFLLAAIGLNNSKILYVATLADWARPTLIIGAVISLCISYRHIWKVSPINKTGKNKTKYESRLTDRLFFLFVAILVIIVLMLPYFLPCNG